jgi:hypothetical protein
MEKYIEACANMHCRGAGFRVERVNDPKSGLQRATGNASLEGPRSDIKNSSACRFRASPSSSRNCTTYSQLHGRLAHVEHTRNQRT